MQKNETKRIRQELTRSDRLLLRKFFQYLAPTMVTFAALSLNEFVDSMLVSNLLGSDAMAIINIGSPLMMVMSAAYSLLGNGGATLYAMALGRRDHKEAGRSLTAAVAVSLAAGLLIMATGMILRDPAVSLLCKEASLREGFDRYYHVLLLSAPLVVSILTAASFLPSAGYPKLSTAVNVIANVVNIIMDYVYIKVLHMGVEGAAWATLTGYVTAAAFMAVVMLTGRIRLHFSRDIASSMSSVKSIITLGRPDATNQIGLAVQFAACNRLAMAAAGANGVVALSLSLQANSVISVFIGAIIGTGVTLMAVLHGQSDYRGEAEVLKTSMKAQLIVSAAGTLLFWVFAPEIAAFYNITEPAQQAMAVEAFRIYVLMLIPRGAVVVYYRYLKIIGLERYSTAMSALDSFAAIVPIAWIMVRLFGINGLWYAYPLTAVLLAAVMVVCNRRYAAGSGGRLRGLLLIESDASEPYETVMDVTISGESEDISTISIRLQELCEERGMRKVDAIRVAMAVEELAVYIAGKKNKSAYADVLVRIRGGDVEVDFRSLGEVFDPNTDYAGDMAENVQVLRSLVSEIRNDYILGMNSTRIVIRPADKAGAKA